MAAAVVSRGVALFCSRLAAASDCHGSNSHHQVQQQQQQQLRNLRHCSTATLRKKGAARSWGHGSQLEATASASGSGSIGVTPGVAGVADSDTAEESAGSNRTRVSIGQAVVQGLREEMEDDAVVQDGPLGFTYAAVFDGHGGVGSAQFLRNELYKDCVESLQGGKLLESDDKTALQDALSNAFHQTDSRLLSWLQTDSNEESGSTATVAFVRNDSITVAHVGDSRMVLSRDGKAVDLSDDHRPFGNGRAARAEISRVKEAGGWITHGRLCSSLSVSRAFGDISFKTKKQEMIEEGIAGRRWTRAFTERFNLDGDWLSVTPDVTRIQLQEDAEFIIIASDGLWDSFKSKDAVKFVRKQLQEHGNVQQAADAIVKAALERQGQDNISVIILDLGRVKQGDSDGLSGLKFW